jgi:BioD-like phosphotransacetylase family protein
MSTTLVTSTAEGTGKTAITVALATLAQEAGATAGYMKPKGTRLESTVGKTRDEDPMLARELLGLDAEMHQLEPVVYSPTFVKEVLRGREDADELRARLTDCFEDLAANADVMLLEGGTLST